MKNPEPLINNFLFRQFVGRTDFMRARAILCRTLLPLLISRDQRNTLKKKVVAYFLAYFPSITPLEAESRAERFLYHYTAKFAEDCINLSLPTIPHYLDTVDRYVFFEGIEHLYQALETDSGLLMVGSHVGTPAFGTVAILTRYLSLPATERPVTRICGEPEAARFPGVLKKLELALEHYQVDARFLLTRRDTREIASEMYDVLTRGGVVTSNLDVLVGGSSRKVFTLFGRAHVYLPALVGAAKAALRTGATLLPWVILRQPKGFRLVFEAPIGPVANLGRDIPDDHPALDDLCEQLKQVLEAWIVAQPEQWTYWDRLQNRLASRQPGGPETP